MNVPLCDMCGHLRGLDSLLMSTARPCVLVKYALHTNDLLLTNQYCHCSYDLSTGVFYLVRSKSGHRLNKLQCYVNVFNTIFVHKECALTRARFISLKYVTINSKRHFLINLMVPAINDP